MACINNPLINYYQCFQEKITLVLNNTKKFPQNAKLLNKLVEFFLIPKKSQSVHLENYKKAVLK